MKKNNLLVKIKKSESNESKRAYEKDVMFDSKTQDRSECVNLRHLSWVINKEDAFYYMRKSI